MAPRLFISNRFEYAWITMKLPNGEKAVIEIRKLRDYCLSEEHPRGKHKARVFAAKLRFAAEDSEILKNALQRAARESDAVQGISDEYGTRHIIDFELGHRERRTTVRSSWIIRCNEDFPRFVTRFVL